MSSTALQVVVHSRTTALINPSDPDNQTDQRSLSGQAVIAEATRLLEADPRVSDVIALRAVRPAAPKEMGVVLGVAVLLDAALVRLLLLPVLLRLSGRAAWACPTWLRRILPTVRFSH